MFRKFEDLKVSRNNSPNLIFFDIQHHLGDCVAGDGSSYRGSTSTTQTWVTCQKWSSKSPHNHYKWTQDNRDNKGIGDHNYCRNPDGDIGGPWCYTVDPDKMWDYCTIRTC